MGSKKTSLRTHINIGYFVTTALVVLFVISLGLLILSVALWNSKVLAIIFAVVLGLSFTGALFMAIFFTERNYRFYKQFYKQNIKNLEAIKNKNLKIKSLDDESVEEFQTINELYSDIKKQNKGYVINTKNVSYKGLPFDYLDKEETIVSNKSFTNNFVSLLTLSDSFRTALVEIYYDADSLEKEVFYKLAALVKKSLTYKNLLISHNNDGNGLYIYIPVFDSVSQIEEEIATMLKNMSIIKTTSEGRTIMAAKVAIVIHPYSAPYQMFSDLEIAKREEKVFNTYIPNKPMTGNSALLFDNFNASQLARASERIDSLDLANPNYTKEIEKILVDLCTYFSFDNVGYVKYNRVTNEYICQRSYSPKKLELVSVGSSLSNKIIDDLNSCRDFDNSYYFSNRKHINNAVAPFIDSHELKSGLFYLTLKNDAVSFMIYFVNFKQTLAFDNSIREGLINIANKIGVYLSAYEDSIISKINDRRFKDVLKLHNTFLYSINPDDYKLFFVSPALKTYYPKMEVGEKCYKALYDREAPCKNCPLKNKKHMVETIKEEVFEARETLQNSNDTARHILLTPKVKDRDTTELFSTDFLVNSYYSFNKFLLDEYALHNEGEMILFSVDNASSIVDTFGNDGYISIMRNAFNVLDTQLEERHSLYTIDNILFALVIPQEDRERVVTIIEKVHAFIKNMMYANKAVRMNVSYYVFKYPVLDTDGKSYFKHIEEVVSGFKNGQKTDFMYFDEDGYTRNASRDLFMFENVLEAFDKKKYYLQYQPVVGNKDRLIHAAEVLLRVKDPFTDELMNISEVISILEKNSRMELISQALNNCIGDLFAKSDVAFFTSLGIQYLSLNFDYLTLADKAFSDNFRKFIKDNNIPKDFLHFEIPEKDIKEHIDGFRSLKWDQIMLVCDQYNGKSVALDKLKEIGFMRVKVSRDVTLNVASDDAALEKALRIWKKAHSLNIPVTFVGIEKRQQTELLHDDYLDSGFQGRFFFPPLDEEHFYQVLRENSVKEIADLEN